ncbi:MAG: Phosphoglycerate mutase [candidate division CPR1 bacterium GW2011_GWA2_42_17]|uniref:Phosphoglycerate mutase n=1 Tax=candidate division CPR1 bacterium GW2011_GWA2_42_17 TaxID=1618341 RepID=A0A0G1BX64_9BACT|nr:MAG: Phosphoglycerate mutase [candidate division CPR1 bacterium GW2011_GWA2_42_17]
MKIYFVRHGESVSNALGLRQGPDGGLTAKGIKQTKAAAKKFSNIPIDLIVSSPYERAKLTAQIAAKATGKKIVYSPLFTERRNPTHLIGKPTDDPESLKITELIYKNYHKKDWRHSNEENFDDFKKRGRQAIRFIEKFAQSKKNILVVTHGLFMRMILAQMMLGSGLDSRTFFKIMHFCKTANTGVMECEYITDKKNIHYRKWQLAAWNDQAHLK